MYGITIEKDSPFPYVRQLCAALRKRILDGSLSPGSRLISSRALAAGLGVARNVVTDAYEQLEAEGYLEGIVGSGTIVTSLGERMIRRRDEAGADRGMTTARGVGRAALHAAGALPSRTASGGAVGVVDFASACGTPDIASFPFRAWKRCIVESIDTARLRDYSFADARGEASLRDEIVLMLFRTRGIECSAEQVFITRGITHALQLVALFLRGRIDRAVLEDPLLNSFKRTLASAGIGMDFVPVDEDGLAVEAIPRTRKPALFVVTPSHQFPSGGILPISRRLRLLSAAEERGGWIFEDDYDGEVRLRGLPVPPVMTLDNDRVFYAATFNKTMFPALRTGFLVVPRCIADSFATFRLGLSDWMETIPGKALASFIRVGHYERRVLALRRLYARRREALVSGLKESFGDAAVVRGDEAGCHCRIAFGKGFRAPRDWRNAEASGVKVATVARYVSGKSPFKDDIILGYGSLDDGEIGEGLRRMGGFLENRR